MASHTLSNYPMSNGRSVEEFLRMLAAMQTADRYCVATPEGWQPGEKVVVPPPTTIADADARAKAGYEYVDWYFSKTELPKVRPKPTRAKKR